MLKSRKDKQLNGSENGGKFSKIPYKVDQLKIDFGVFIQIRSDKLILKPLVIVNLY